MKKATLILTFFIVISKNLFPIPQHAILNNETSFFCTVKYQYCGKKIKITLQPGEQVYIEANKVTNLTCKFYNKGVFPKKFSYPWINGTYRFTQDKNRNIFESKYYEMMHASPRSWCSIQ